MFFIKSCYNVVKYLIGICKMGCFKTVIAHVVHFNADPLSLSAKRNGT